MPNLKTIKSIVMRASYFEEGRLILMKKDGITTWTNIDAPIPASSETGEKQTRRLADFLVPHLLNQASHPVRVVCSPMKRTLETIKPTLERLHKSGERVCQVIVNAFYHESEGCHIRDKAGMIRLLDCLVESRQLYTYTYYIL